MFVMRSARGDDTRTGVVTAHRSQNYPPYALRFLSGRLCAVKEMQCTDAVHCALVLRLTRVRACEIT